MPFEKGQSGNPATQFKPGGVGNPRGPKPKIITAINLKLEEQGFETAQKVEIVEAYTRLLNMPLAKVAAIANKNIFYKEKESGQIIYLEEGDEYPMLYRMVAKEMLGKNGANMLENMLDRAFGKAKEEVKLTHQTPPREPDLSNFTSDELEYWEYLLSKAFPD